MSNSFRPERADEQHGSDDDVLLVAIAKDRSRVAFTQFFERHQHAAYSLAFQMTSHRAWAEDALQDAMLEVWLHADNYHPGHARSWLLRLVANRCLRLLRGQRRHERKTKADNKINLPTKRSQESDQSELLDAVRGQMALLPEHHRHLLTLYFGAGLTQKQIASALDMPTRTVSFKIDETIKKLRALLTKAGFATALPLLDQNGLQQIICSGHQAPKNLSDRVLEGLKPDNGVNQSHIQTGSRASRFIWPAATTITMILIFCGLWIRNERQPIAESPDDSATSNIPIAEKPLYIKWDFANDRANDLNVFQGEWQWKKFMGRGAMTIPKVPNTLYTGILLPKQLPSKPFLFSILASAPKDCELAANCVWINKQGTIPYHMYRRKLRAKTRFQKLLIYVLGQYVIQTMNGKTSIVQKYERAYPSRQMIFLIQNWNIHEIELRELRPKERAALTLDPLVEVKRLKQDPECTMETRKSTPIF